MYKSILTLALTITALTVLTGCGPSSGGSSGVEPRVFTTANFDQEVINSDKPVLVDFWATWCGPCKAIAPTIDALAGEYEGKAVIGKVNFDNNKPLAQKHGVTGLPTLIIFKDGKEFTRIIGPDSKANIAAKLDAALGSS